MILSISKIFWAIMRFVQASYRFVLNEQVIICLPKDNCFSLGRRLFLHGIKTWFWSAAKMNFPDVSNMLTRYKAWAVAENLDALGYYMALQHIPRCRCLNRAAVERPHRSLFLLRNTFQVLLSILMHLKTNVFSFQTVVIFSYLGMIK